jgi:hypothetical protein
MIPKTNSTEIQLEVLMKIKEVYRFDSDLSDRLLLISIFFNYRTGGGLRLSKLGFDICSKFNLFDFTPIKLQKKDRNSLVYTSLDRVCTSPYYIQGETLYLTDEFVLAQLTFCRDDFAKLFAAFM